MVVFQTHVKSPGWEKRMAQSFPIQSWNLIGPAVVSASKSGAMLPSLNDAAILLSCFLVEWSSVIYA